MEAFITVLIIIACILLAIIILIQNPKGGGLDSTFGSASQLGGVQKTTNFLEKTTWGLMITIVVLSLASATFNGTATSVESNYQDELPAQPVTPEVAPEQGE